MSLLFKYSESLRVRRMSWRTWIYIAVFPLLIVYYECILNLSTSRNLFSWGTPMMVLFSFAYGLLVFLIVSFLKRPKLNRIVTTLLMILLSVPYLVQYFVYSGFKSFYDVTTMTSGAKDMAGSYMSETMQVIFSWGGILRIVLFMLPAVLF